MRKPRLIYCNDGRHYLLYRFDPPMSLHRLQQPVDEILGTGVDTLSYGLGSGQTFWHDTKVGLRWGERIKQHNSGVMWWRAGENLEHALRAGYDPLKVVVDRAHEKGVQVFGTLKMNDPGWPGGENKYWLGKLKWDNPEVMVGEEDPDEPRVATCSDYARPEVRQERLQVIEEVCDRYGLDGLEMDDCLKDSHVRVFFKPSEARQNAPILTEFVREVRKLLDRIGEKRGERLCLATRVHPVEDENLKVGADVRTWLSEGLVDLVIPYLGGLGDKLVDSQPSFGWLAEAAHEAGAWVYAPIGSIPYDDRYDKATVEMYRAGATNARVGGADGLYLEGLPWPHTEREYMILREMGDPDIHRRKTKHYVLAPGNDGPDSAPLGRHLPITLQEGVPARMPVFVGDALDAARKDGELRSVSLGVRIEQTCPQDRLFFRFNGQELPLNAARVRTYYGGTVPYAAHRGGLPERIDTHYWFHFDLPLDRVREGDNDLEVTMELHFKALTAERVLVQVELRIDYDEPPVPVGTQM